MTQIPEISHATDSITPISLATAHTRMVAGLLQGFALYFLYRAARDHLWPATEPLLFAPLLLTLVVVPVLWVSSLGYLSLGALARWLFAAAVITMGLGYYDIWRTVGSPVTQVLDNQGVQRAQFPSVLLWVFALAGFFCAHALVLSAALDRRIIAKYTTYFDIAWKLLIQIKFSVIFVGAVWCVLTLGAALFKLIGLGFFDEIINKAWFAIPVSVFSFVCAIHLTDVRPAIVRSVRNLLLGLQSWTLPLTVLIVGGFLVSIPFTGLASLWATKHATTVLLFAAAALIAMVNTAFQNGEMSDQLARVLRVSARVASLLLLPLMALAAYAMYLRVSEYGWTTDRIIATCCVAVGFCYALGYGWAAARSPVWLAAIAPVNIAMSGVVLGLLLALFSPVMDPARLSVNRQLQRLENGRQSASSFDFDYLKFEGKRFGMVALTQLKDSTEGKDAAVVRDRASQTLAKLNRWQKTEQVLTPAQLQSQLNAWPAGAQIPESFLGQNWSVMSSDFSLPACLRTPNAACDVLAFEVGGNPKGGLLVLGRGADFQTGVVFSQTQVAGPWEISATLPNAVVRCEALRSRLLSGQYKRVAPQVKDIEMDGQRYSLVPSSNHSVPCEVHK